MTKIRLLGLLLGLLLLCSGCSKTGAETSILQLNADIGATKEHLIIKNGDACVWKNATVTINDEFVYQTDLIPRGNTSIPFSLFANQRGETYRLRPLRPMDIHILVPEITEGKKGQFKW